MDLAKARETALACRNADELLTFFYKLQTYDEFVERDYQSIFRGYVVRDPDDVRLLIPMINIVNKGTIQVAPSTLPGHPGFGLFADRTFNAGDYICEYGGYTSATPTMYDYDPDVKALSAYFLAIDRVTWIQDARMHFRLDEPGRFPNGLPWQYKKDVMEGYDVEKHRNNAQFVTTKALRRNALYASRKIKKGDEIFADYGPSYAWETIFDMGFLKKLFGPQWKPEFIPEEPKWLEAWNPETTLSTMRKTLNSRYGTLDTWVFYYETAVAEGLSRADIRNTFLDYYVIKSDTDHRRTDLLLQALRVYESFNVDPAPVTLNVKNHLVYSRDVLVVDTQIATIGGILTDAPIMEGMIRIDGYGKMWYLYPNRLYRLGDWGNHAQFGDDANAYLRLRIQDMVVEVRTRRPVKHNERVIIILE